MSALMSKVSFGFGISRSFRTRSRRSLRRWPLPALGLAALLILAGCGGSGSSKVQKVQGAGFSFQVPAGWSVVRQGSSVAAVNGSVDRAEVILYTLEKPYRAALFARTARELDGVVTRLAGQLSGRVVRRATTEVAGRKVRTYRIDYDHGKTDEIAFVLDGTKEYYLLCRRLTAAADTDCAALFSTFALG